MGTQLVGHISSDDWHGGDASHRVTSVTYDSEILVGIGHDTAPDTHRPKRIVNGILELNWNR